MKISSASKKVLASALSAAMVVAFAPAAAFAAAGDKCPVTIDVDGGTVVSGNTDFSAAKVGDTISLPSLEKDGYTVDHFWYDADEDGVDDGDAAEDFTSTFTVPSAASATLKAVYKTPSLGNVTFTQVEEGEDAAITVNYKDFTAQNTKENSAYTLSVKKDGAADALYTWNFAAEAGDTGHKHAVVAAGSKTLNFKSNIYTGETDAVALNNLASGKYVVELSDNKGVVSTKTVELVKVTFVDADGNKYACFYDKKTGVNISSGTYVDADGYVFDKAASMKVSGDVTVTESEATAAVSKTSYADGVVSFKVSDSEAANAKDKFDIAVTDSTGATAWSASVKGDAINGTTGKTFTFTFDATDADKQHAATSQVAGKYTVTVVKTPEEGDAATVKAVAFTLTEFKYSAGDNGKLAGSLKAASDVFVADAGYTILSDAVVTANKGYTVDADTGWLLNGKKINAATNPVKAGSVNELVASYKADEADPAQVATPAVVSVERAESAADKTKWEYTVKVSCATAGAAVTYSTGNTTTGKGQSYPSAGIKVTASKSATPEDIYVVASPATGATASTITKDSEVLHLTFNDKSAGFAAYTAGATSQLEAYVGKSTDKWLAAADVKSAIEAGNASLSAFGYYVDASDEKVAEAELAAYKALYEAVDKAAAAYLAQYEDGAPVVSGDKAYVVDADAMKEAKKLIADIEKKVAKAEAAKNASADTYKGAIYSDFSSTRAYSILYVVDHSNLYDESKDYTAADITAAKAVTEQLQAATDADSAKAALEAYAALTDAQKKLVATADVTAAQKVVSDAEAAQKVADEQDQTAVKYCNTLKKKTVKVAKKTKKTAKKFSVKWNSQVSESGNKVTYAKVSGAAKVTVSANGKATLKKGVKKGTYKAKVKVTCGNATRTVTAKFIVK